MSGPDPSVPSLPSLSPGAKSIMLAFRMFANMTPHATALDVALRAAHTVGGQSVAVVMGNLSWVGSLFAADCLTKFDERNLDVGFVLVQTFEAAAQQMLIEAGGSASSSRRPNGIEHHPSQPGQAAFHQEMLGQRQERGRSRSRGRGTAAVPSGLSPGVLPQLTFGGAASSSASSVPLAQAMAAQRHAVPVAGKGGYKDARKGSDEFGKSGQGIGSTLAVRSEESELQLTADHLEQLKAAGLTVEQYKELRASGDLEKLQQQAVVQMQAMMAAAAAASAPEPPPPAAPTEEENADAAQQYFLAQQIQFYEQAQRFEMDRQKQEEGPQKLTLPQPGKLPIEPTEIGYNPMRPRNVCQHWLQGRCHREKCAYSHDYSSLEATQAQKDEEKRQQEPWETMLPVERMKKKREMCQRLKKKGRCLLEEKCMFAHSEKDLGTVALVIDDNVKTEICSHWVKGKCVFGKKCVYAHGMHQIGQLQPPPEVRGVR